MSSRILRLALVALVIAVVARARRRRAQSAGSPVTAAPTPWEPLEPRAEPEAPGARSAPSRPVPESAARSDGVASSIDEGLSGRERGGEAWVRPDEAGDCPASHPLKAKESSKIVHQPGGLSYDRTNADRCYVDLGAAESDGYRPAKR